MEESTVFATAVNQNAPFSGYKPAGKMNSTELAKCP
jgi:hypothetical protein